LAAKVKADEAELKAAADRRAKAEAEAKAVAVAEAKAEAEKRIKDQLAADAKKAKATLAVEGTNTITQSTKGSEADKYLPAGSTTDKRGLTMDTAQNPRLDKNGNVVSAEDAKYLNFMDMIDGGGPGRAGPEFQTKSQAKDSPTGGEKTGTIASFGLVRRHLTRALSPRVLLVLSTLGALSAAL
jgi:membrane protein involved in colicin uptake